LRLGQGCKRSSWVKLNKPEATCRCATATSIGALALYRICHLTWRATVGADSEVLGRQIKAASPLSESSMEPRPERASMSLTGSSVITVGPSGETMSSWSTAVTAWTITGPASRESRWCQFAQREALDPRRMSSAPESTRGKGWFHCLAAQHCARVMTTRRVHGCLSPNQYEPRSSTKARVRRRGAGKTESLWIGGFEVCSHRFGRR
jgi:hypothetical protein